MLNSEIVSVALFFAGISILLLGAVFVLSNARDTTFIRLSCHIQLIRVVTGLLSCVGVLLLVQLAYIVQTFPIDLLATIAALIKILIILILIVLILLILWQNVLPWHKKLKTLQAWFRLKSLIGTLQDKIRRHTATAQDYDQARRAIEDFFRDLEKELGKQPIKPEDFSEKELERLRELAEALQKYLDDTDTPEELKELLRRILDMLKGLII